MGLNRTYAGCNSTQLNSTLKNGCQHFA